MASTEESAEYDAEKGGGDSDEDCEVYFLKPVNEYNIVDKIKEANKELFSGDAEPTPQLTDPNGNAAANGSGEATSQRKVTFAPNLENYEPEEGDDRGGGDAETNNNYTGADEADEAVMPRTLAELKLRSPETGKFPAIDEDEDAEIKANEAEIAVLKAEDRELMMEIEAAREQDAKRSNKKKREESGEPEPEEEVKQSESEPDNVDEICEEIIVMDMEESRTVAVEGSAAHRRIIKQDTFDYDNKSLSNLLTSDYEEEIEEDDDVEGEDGEEKDSGVKADEEEANDADKTLSESSSSNNNSSSTESAKDAEGSTERPDQQQAEGEEEEDDTDNLSIIVSSYIPDDFPRLLSAGSTRRSKCGQHAATAASPGSTTKSSRLSFTKRFSFRRKAKAPQQSTGGGGSASATKGAGVCCSKSPRLGGRAGGHAHHHRDDEPPVIDLKLHYKTCCEYRQSTLERLPRYTGYLSEYGLSREQLLEREQRLQQKQRFVLEQTLKTTEQEMAKMQDNERAFTTWLKNKMRYPINRTRNMFDVRKKSRAAVVPPPPQPPKVCSSPYRRHCAGGCGGESAATSPSRLITPFTIAGGIFDLAPYHPPKRTDD